MKEPSKKKNLTSEEKAKKKARQKRLIIVWCILLVIGVAMVIPSIVKQSENQDSELPENYQTYKTFWSELEKGNIYKIKYSGTDDYFKYYLVSDKETEYQTDNPHYQKFKRDVLQLGVQEFITSNVGEYLSLIPAIVYSALFVVAVFLILKQTVISSDVSAVKEKPDMTFDDVAGMKEIKQEFKNLVTLMQNKKENTLDARLPHGILLEGPPGTGKTYMVKAFAGECNMNYYAINGSQIGNLFVGLGANQINALFKKAKKNAPAVIFIDEIDAIGEKRKGSMGGVDRDATHTLTALLTNMDGFQGNEDIIVIGATNRAEDLDPALLRAGRFDKKFVVNPPDKADRTEIVKYYFSKKNLSDDVSIDWFVNETAGYTPAMIESVVNEASIIAIERKENVLTKDMLDAAIIQTEMRGKKKENAHITDDIKKITAYHEAGHTVVGALLCKKTVSRVTVIPSTSGAGGYTKLTEDDMTLLSNDEIFNRLCMMYAGREAELIYQGNDIKKVTVGCSSDVAKATELIRQFADYLPTEDKDDVLSNDEMLDTSQFGWTGEKYTYERAKKISEYVIRNTRAFLKAHWDMVEKIANELLLKETLYKEDLNEILGNLNIDK